MLCPVELRALCTQVYRPGVVVQDGSASCCPAEHWALSGHHGLANAVPQPFKVSPAVVVRLWDIAGDQTGCPIRGDY